MRYDVAADDFRDAHSATRTPVALCASTSQWPVGETHAVVPGSEVTRWGISLARLVLFSDLGLQQGWWEEQVRGPRA